MEMKKGLELWQLKFCSTPFRSSLCISLQNFTYLATQAFIQENLLKDHWLNIILHQHRFETKAYRFWISKTMPRIIQWFRKTSLCLLSSSLAFASTSTSPVWYCFLQQTSERGRKFDPGVMTPVSHISTAGFNTQFWLLIQFPVNAGSGMQQW